MSVGPSDAKEFRSKQFSCNAIGYVASPFRERNGTPRQSLIAPSAKGYIVIDPLWAPQDSLQNLEEYSHIWVLFVFDKNTNEVRRSAGCIKAKVSPPRLDGGKVGVFASRSPHRPSNIGMTVVHLDSVDHEGGILYISGLDICDRTPVLDIKPYIVPDSLKDFTCPDWVAAKSSSQCMSDVLFTDDCMEQLSLLEDKLLFYKKSEEIISAVREVLLWDIRPVFKRKKEVNFALWFDVCNFLYRISEDRVVLVHACEYWPDSKAR